MLMSEFYAGDDEEEKPSFKGFAFLLFTSIFPKDNYLRRSG